MEATPLMLRQSMDCKINDDLNGTNECDANTTPDRKTHKTALSPILSLILAVICNSTGIIVLVLTTYFGKIASFLRVLPFLSFICDTIFWLFHAHRFLSKPMPPSPTSLFFAAIGLIIYGINATTNLLSGLTPFLSELSVVAPYLPVLCIASAALSTTLSAIGLCGAANEYTSKPWTRTPRSTLHLANKAINTTALATITALTIPFILATGGIVITAGLVNPFTAGPVVATLFSLMLAASLILVTMKLVKKYSDHCLEKQAAKEAAAHIKSPYEKLGIHPSQLDLLGRDERKKWVWNIYKKNEKNISKSSVDEAQKLTQLKDNYQAFELLKSARATALYETFKSADEENTHRTHNPHYKEPDSSQKILLSLSRHPLRKLSDSNSNSDYPTGQGGRLFVTAKPQLVAGGHLAIAEHRSGLGRCV